MERGCGALRRVLTETKIPARFFQHLSPQIYAQSALMVPVHLPATPSYIVAGRIQQVYEKVLSRCDGIQYRRPLEKDAQLHNIPSSGGGCSGRGCVVEIRLGQCQARRCTGACTQWLWGLKGRVDQPWPTSTTSCGGVAAPTVEVVSALTPWHPPTRIRLGGRRPRVEQDAWRKKGGGRGRARGAMFQFSCLGVTRCPNHRC